MTCQVQAALVKWVQCTVRSSFLNFWVVITRLALCVTPQVGGSPVGVRFSPPQWWRDLIRCRIDLLNFSMGFNIIGPYMEFLHLNWYIAEWPVKEPKDPWPRVLSLPGALVVCWRPHPAGTWQYKVRWSVPQRHLRYPLPWPCKGSCPLPEESCFIPELTAPCKVDSFIRRFRWQNISRRKAWTPAYTLLVFTCNTAAQLY